MSRSNQEHAARLERKLGLFPLTNIVIANMIGAGIFTTSGVMMGAVQNPLVMVLLWLVGGVIAVCGALCYGEMGAAFPRAGGEYRFLSELYSPLLGFLSGWVSFVAGFSAAIAAVAIGCSEYLYRMIPAVYEAAPLSPEGLHKWVAMALIAVFTAVHARGVDFGALVQNWLTLFKVALLVVLIGAGFAFGEGDLTPLTRPPPVSFDFSSLKAMALGLVWVMYAYTGWNASAYLGSEVRHPRRNLPGSLVLGTLIVTGLYLLLNVLYVYAIGPAEMAGVIPVGSLAVRSMFGESADALFSGLVAFGFLSAIGAFIMLGPRVCYAMARDGFFIRQAARVHPKFRTPFNAIVTQGVFACLIVLTGTLEQIFTFIGFALSFFPILVVAGVFRLRRRATGAPRMPGFPVTAMIFLVVTSTVLVLGFLERPLEATVALVTVALGVPAYFWFRGRD